MEWLLLAEAAASFILPYFIAYRDDPFAPLRQRRAGWNEVFSALGLGLTVRERKDRLLALPALSALAYCFGFLTNSWGAVLGGSAALFAYVAAKTPFPFSKRDIALPYPRKGRARFERPRAKAELTGRAVDVSNLRLFYISYRNGTAFSLPEGKVRLSDLIAGYLEQERPEFAWIQIIYARASAHRYLEAQKLRILHDKELRNGRGMAWASQAEIYLKKINEMLASDLFAVAVRGVVIGASPMDMVLSYSDEADSLAVFETDDPGLLYEMATRKLSAEIPSWRSEPSFFFARNLRLFASPPVSARTASVAPLGLQPLKGWDDAEDGVRSEPVELDPVPVLDESFHFPAEGSIELVYDGRLRVLAGGLLAKALSSGTATSGYSALESFKSKLKPSA